MSEINLPEPYGWLHDANGNDPLTFAREMKPMTALLCSTLGVYTAEQVRQAVLAERERCARVCDAQCEVYGIKMDQTDRERQEERWDRLHAYQEAVENIAAAIRRG